MAVFSFQTVTGFSIAGNYAAVVHHWNVDDPTGADAWENANALRIALNTPVAGFEFIDEMLPWLANDCFVSSIRARQVLPTPGPEAVNVFTPTDKVGTWPEPSEQLQVAACSIWITDHPNHKVGKTFWPGLPEGALDNGNWDPTWLTSFDAYIDALDTGPVQSTVGDFRLAVRYAGVPDVFRDVIGWNLSPTPGTQRRRLVPY